MVTKNQKDIYIKVKMDKKINIFFTKLMERGKNNRTLLIKYTEWNALLYLVIGLTLFFQSNIFVKIGLFPELYGRDEGFLQFLGIFVMLIGWYSYFGARTNRISITLASIVSRLIIFPFFVSIIVLSGNLEIDFFIFPLIEAISLAIVAFFLWTQELNHSK
tara:strand:+ start:53 stop:535 length:483 start_codon:yes stop_codon:yes gene_type:complete